MSYGLAIVNPTLTENTAAPAVDEGALILRCQAVSILANKFIEFGLLIRVELAIHGFHQQSLKMLFFRRM